MSEPTGNTLEELLPQLPPETPFFILDESIAVWFPPGVTGPGIMDDSSQLAAESLAAQFGCIFKYDSFMGQWCFIRPATRQ